MVTVNIENMKVCSSVKFVKVVDVGPAVQSYDNAAGLLMVRAEIQPHVAEEESCDTSNVTHKKKH